MIDADRRHRAWVSRVRGYIPGRHLWQTDERAAHGFPSPKVEVDQKMSVRLMIAALIYLRINSVLFAAGIIAILAIQPLPSNVREWIPMVIVTAAFLGLPISWYLAPRLRAR